VRERFTVRVGAGFAGRIAKEQRPVVIDDLEPGQAVNPLLYQKGVRSLMGVPLVASQEVVGVMHAGSRTARRFSSEDVALLQVAADRAALAIEHARLFDAERRARAEAERALERLRSLGAVTEAALAYLDLDELLAVLLERTVEILRADTSAVLLVEENGRWLAARAAKGLEEEVERGFRLPIGEGFAGRVAAEQSPVVLPRVLPGTVVNPLMFEKGVQSLLGVPLVVERRLIGVLHVGTLTPREFTDDDIQLLQLVADRAALAIEHDRLFEQHRIAATLQEALLPSDLGRAPGVAFAGRYRPAAEAASIGGDWYDVVKLPGGRVGVAIGDVVGHGVHAATLMASLRNALHAYAIEGLAPADVAQRLGAFADSIGAERLATYVYGILDSDRDLFTFVNASHPQPVVVNPDGTAAYLSAPVLPPLGVSTGPPPEEMSVTIEPGSTLLLYTDGLIERRGVRLAGRHEELLAVAAAAPFDPELLCETVVDKLVGAERTADDVAVLAVQRVPAPGRALHVTVATRAEELAPVRRLLRLWLADVGADDDAISAFVLASGEACSNAMEHAYGPGDQTFDVMAEASGDEAVVTVRDRGRWRAPRGVNRGRGLRLIEAFMDDVEVIRADDGTMVRMRRRLTG
jgi:GAF domain-containing protein/anti-sigma regulatory factor (Ser/Thr protein kinase)